MDAFLKYFYQDVGLIGKAIANIFTSIFSAFNTIFNFPMRMNIIKSYSKDLNAVGWAMVILSNLIIAVIAGIIIFLIVKGIKRLTKFKAPAAENEKLRDEVAKLQREVLKLGYEKDKIMAMKLAEAGMDPRKELMPGLDADGNPIEDSEQSEEGTGEDEEFVAGKRNTFSGPPVDP